MAEKRRVVCPHCDATNAVPADREPLVAKCGRCHQKLFEGAPAALDAARARKLIRNSDLLLIVDFWAACCGPCRAMAPIFEQAARSLEPRAGTWRYGVGGAYRPFAHRLSRAEWLIGDPPRHNPSARMAHKDFHRSLLASCGLPSLLAFVDSLYDYVDRYRMMSQPAKTGRSAISSPSIASWLTPPSTAT